MDDLISRQKALEFTVSHGINIGAKIYVPLGDVKEYLRDLPSAQKKGKWIDGHCSECGCDVPAYIEDWKWVRDMDAKYCPVCGARMEKEE